MQENRNEKNAKGSISLDIYVDKYNRRVRIDDYLGNIDLIIEESERIAQLYTADKLIVKARSEHFKRLLEKGYRFEGLIDGYFRGSDCLFFSKFYSPERKANVHWFTEDQIAADVHLLNRRKHAWNPPADYKLRKMKEADSDSLADLYKQVFEIYPTPLDDPNYIKKTMKEGTVYYGFEYKGRMVSAASAEVNSFYKNAELTDCATLKEHRKHGLMKVLLVQLEKELTDNGIYCAYSLARALSFGMNAAFHQLGYSYRGRLIKNCYIFDKLEDMNIWVKDLSQTE